MIGLLLAIVGDPGSVTVAQVAEVRAAAPAYRAMFDERMLDFTTARFRDVRVTINTEAEQPRPFLCGHVNGKNRLGAYTGWQPFFATQDAVIIGDDDFNRDLVSMSCEGPAIVRDPADRSDWLRHR